MAFLKSNVSAFENFLRAKYERLIGASVNQSTPYFMYLDPSSICQLRCPFCPTGQENTFRRTKPEYVVRDRSLMSLEILEDVLAELGENLFLALLYNWGEPLLNKNLPHFIQKLKKYQITSEIDSNLSLPLNERFIDDLLSSGVDTIRASIDGATQETYEQYRIGGRFELAKENLTRLARARDRLGLKTSLVWTFLLFSFNEHEVEKARSFCADLGIQFSARDAHIDLDTHPQWLPSHRKHEAPALVPAPTRVATSEPGTAIEFSPISKEPAPVNSPETNQSATLISSRPTDSCSWHYAISIVNASGTVSPCCALWSQTSDFESVIPGKSSFLSIWNGTNFQRARAAFAGKDTSQFSGTKRSANPVHSAFSLKITTLAGSQR